MLHLARKLRLTDYFTLAWGTMVGVGWLVVMDDWLLRGGALGALLGFAIGGALLFPIGWVYGRLVAAMPDAAGEIAYTAAAFSRPISFSTGWMSAPGRRWRWAASPGTSCLRSIHWKFTESPDGPYTFPISSSDLHSRHCLPP